MHRWTADGWIDAYIIDVDMLGLWEFSLFKNQKNKMINLYIRRKKIKMEDQSASTN